MDETGDLWAARAVRDHEYRRYIGRDPKSRGYNILHGALAVLIANHTGKEHEDIGWAIGDAIYEYLVKQGKTVEDIEKNPSEFAKLVVKKLQEREIIGPTVARSTQKAIKEVIPYTVKLINKMWPKDHNIKHLRAMEEAFSPDTRDPVRTLKAAGIDITEELEELRNAIAEVTGKKPKAATKGRKKKPSSTKKAVKGELIKSRVPENVKLEAWKLLGVLNGLKYSGYSERAVEKAVEDLLAEGKELAERGDLETLGIYLWTAHLLREGRLARQKSS
ncbi:hypothetical protein JCM16138_08890 [Thermococcus atlanticus]